MNDTPETDTMYDNVWSPKVASDALIKMRSLCRKLERERNELEKQLRDSQTPNGLKSAPPCE